MFWKNVKYWFVLILSIMSIAFPLALCICAFLFNSQIADFFAAMGVTVENPALYIVMPIGIVLGIIGLASQGKIREMRVNARRDVEYDEFGQSKTKGKYEYLSKEERDMIDLQKTADMERLVNTTALKKMTQQGPPDPMKELDEMIGLAPMKETVKEMVARMAFETEENKKKPKKERTNIALSGRHMVFTGSPGTGKAQPLYSKVLTPNGFVRMGDIKVGDTVIAADGSYAKVLGVFPQGKKKVYEMTLHDGSKCRSSDEHLWKVQTRLDRIFNEYRIIETKDMLGKIYCPQEPGRLNYSIQVPKNISMQERTFVIHPYLLGALLGDGCLTERQGNSVGFSNKDTEILDRVQSLLPPGLRLSKNSKKDRTCDYRIVKQDLSEQAVISRSLFFNELYRLGLKGTYSHSKFIPQEYLYASYEQRLELLRGLMDTDGTVSTFGEMSYGTASLMLANNFMELVRSLGGNAILSIKKCSYKDKNGKLIQCKDSYKISVSFPDSTLMPFYLPRKCERVRPSRFKHKFIQSLEYVGEEECQCIYIDHPSHLYITDDYIVTHNTTTARILTSFLHQYGYIKENKCIEIDGNFLKAGTESATKTELIVRHAFGGVLFIDEAYSLMDSSDRSGEQVIATLIKQMEDNRGKFILILAGYTNEMRDLIAKNPGFESRIKEYLHFPDYNVIEMREILTSMAKKVNFTVDEAVWPQYDMIVSRERALQSFGNARTVRNILDKAIDKHSLNIANKTLPPEMRYVLTVQDFQNLKLGGIGFGREY